MNLSLDWFLWLSIALAEIVVFIQAIARNSSRVEFRRFTEYLGFSATSRVFLIILWAVTHNFRLYGIFGQAASAVTVLMIGAAIIEIWQRVFGPARALPPKTAMKFLIALCAAYPACFLLAQLCRARTGNAFAASLWTIELIITSIAATTVLMLVSYSRKLNITWRPIHERIAMGFAISLSASAFAALAAGRLVGMLTAQRFSQIAYIVALGVWGWALSTRDVPEEKLDIGTLRTLWHDMNETQAELTVR